MADSVMQKEYPDGKQRLVICSAQWKDKEKSTMNDNDWLIDQIRTRDKKTQFGRGILTADRFVRTLADAAGLDACYQYASNKTTSFDDIIQKASRTLVYSNDEMDLEEKATSSFQFKALMEGAGEEVRLPKNTLMVFRHKLTTSMEDRDKDILHSKGMNLDPKMLLLWQHIHTMPLGPYLYTVSQDDKSVRVVSAIVDMNDTTHDAAVMIDNGMGRFSHGFKAVSFEKRKDTKGKETNGFEIHQADVMEESLVSVPANVGAETEEVLLSLVEGGKLTSPMMKSVGETIRNNRSKQVQGIEIIYRESDGKHQKEVTCSSLSDLKAAADSGLLDLKEDEDGDQSRDQRVEGEGTETKAEPSTSEEADVDRDEGTDEETMPGDKEVKKEDFSCECLECGHTTETKEHCREIECSECGGEMRRAERPGPGKNVKGAYVDLEGSYEDLKDKLRNLLVKKHNDKGIDIVATYPNQLIYKVWNNSIGSADVFEDTFYLVGWKIENSIPVLDGESEEVTVSGEVRKKYFGTEEKAGRVISKKNETAIKEARDDIKAASQMEGLARPCRALLVSAHRGLGSVLDALGTMGEASLDIEVKDVMVAFLAKANAEERKKMQDMLTAFSMVEDCKRTTKLYHALGK